jgi:hypothetical protein
MDINAQKTKTMVISRNPVQHTITLVGQQMEVESFKYLGATISQDGRIDLEVNNRITAAGRLYHAISRAFTGKREVSKKSKLTVYQTVYLPTLTYSTESWTLGAKQHSRLQAAEMRYLQRVEQKTRKDKVHNQMIQMALNVKPLQSQIQQMQLRWFGHVVRMPESRYPRMAWEA